MGAALSLSNFLPMFGTVFGTLMQMQAARSQANMQAMQMEMMAQQADINRQRLAMEQEMAADKAADEASLLRKRLRSAQGAARALSAARGFNPDAGLAESVLNANEAAFLQDLFALRKNAFGEQLSYGFAQQDLALEASNRRAQASAARSAGRVNALSALISGGTSFASQWSAYKASQADTSYYTGSNGYGFSLGASNPRMMWDEWRRGR